MIRYFGTLKGGLMGYYKTAVVLSWTCVAIFLCLSSVYRDDYGMLPFSLVIAAAGGVIPALVCAWILRLLGRASRLKWSFFWIVNGGFLGIIYPLICKIIIKSVIGHVAIDSVKGSLVFAVFGPAILMEFGWSGLAVIAVTGAINGAMLYHIDKPAKSP